MRTNLAYRDPRASESSAAEPMTIPVEVARLYDELRDCIQANDQQGVRRIFGELVRARRPVSEISGVVDGLSKPEQKQEPEASSSPLDDREPAEQDPDPSTDPTVMPPRDETGAAATTSGPERDRALTEEWLEPSTTIPEVEQSTAEAAPQSSDWAATTYFEPESSQDVAVPTEEVEQSGSGEIASSLDAVPASGRRTALLSSRAHLPAALVLLLLVVGAGVFLLMRPAPEEGGAPTVLPVDASSIGSAAPSVTGSAPAEQSSTIAAPAAADHSPAAVIAPVQPPVASPLPVAAALPAGRSTDQPNANSAIIGSQAPNKAVAAPEASAPAAPAPAIAPAVPGSPSPGPPGVRPPLANVEVPTKAAAVVPEAADRPAPSPAIAPAASEGASADRPDPKPVVAGLEAPKNVVPAMPPTAPASSGPPAITPVTAAPESAQLKESPNTSVETAPLVERGDRLFGVGDIASARLFYERAADAGDGQAALRLGETYDPAFLERAQLRVQGDRALAVFWYRRARELGASDAEILLKGVQAR
jgi:hypothetical protein